MNTTLSKAVKGLELAASYADDGAVCTAIARAQEALSLLEKEKRRRIKLGLIPGGEKKV